MFKQSNQIFLRVRSSPDLEVVPLEGRFGHGGIFLVDVGVEWLHCVCVSIQRKHIAVVASLLHIRVHVGILADFLIDLVTADVTVWITLELIGSKSDVRGLKLVNHV